MYLHSHQPIIPIQIRAAPKSERELRLLMADKNAWVGIPVSVVPQEEARKELPVRYTTHPHAHKLKNI